MKEMNQMLDLQPFFPENLQIENTEVLEDAVYISIKSVTQQITCPRCGAVMKKRHTSHSRTVQDLPIFWKRTYLKIKCFDFDCENPDCNCISKAETFDGFLKNYSKMTERLVDLVIGLALDTSCEAAARILNTMNVKISGDTVIRTLINRYQETPVPSSGYCVGVDDFSLKKGRIYGTIIVDGETHTPLAVLNGRDGESLKEWLKQNRHVTAISRDRASAYARAIEEVLPEAMQIADRFHLYQNLMTAVKKIVKGEIQSEKEEDSKKNASHCG